MLKRNQQRRIVSRGARFAIVASEFNRRYVDAMVRAAEAELSRAGVQSVRVIRVPGAFEIPVMVAKVAAARSGRPDAILCLGAIFRGETPHAQQIGDAVSQALMDLQVRHRLPVIHGVYLFENERQARVRCLSPKWGRGTELARTALAMAALMSSE